jgi:hypothetical protein
MDVGMGHSFMDAYGSIEEDTVAYGSGMWVHRHEAWVLWGGTRYGTYAAN